MDSLFTSVAALLGITVITIIATGSVITVVVNRMADWHRRRNRGRARAR